MRNTACGALLGNSAALQKTLQQIARVAATQVPVLITGESGTGKELVARALHEGSPRRGHPLIAVNCASIPRELFESEFFGHARGAFSGAIAERSGRFQAAHEGTLFLDEVVEFPPDLQGKLLRVLEDGYVQRLGDDRGRLVDVVVIAATNRQPADAIRAGHLRQDLYYRLAAFEINLPPLRARREDIHVLVAHFLQEFAPERYQRFTISAESRRALVDYDWPGNVRELRNVVRRAVLLSEGIELRIDLAFTEAEPAPLPAPAAPTAPHPRLDRSRAVLSQGELDRLERDNIIAALLRTHWRIAGPHGAAMLLGIKPSTLASRIKRLGLCPTLRVDEVSLERIRA